MGEAAAASVLLHESLGPLGDLLGWHVFLVGGDPPLVANRVLDAGAAVPIDVTRTINWQWLEA